MSQQKVDTARTDGGSRTGGRRPVGHASSRPAVTDHMRTTATAQRAVGNARLGRIMGATDCVGGCPPAGCAQGHAAPPPTASTRRRPTADAFASEGSVTDQTVPPAAASAAGVPPAPVPAATLPGPAPVPTARPAAVLPGPLPPSRGVGAPTGVQGAAPPVSPAPGPLGALGPLVGDVALGAANALVGVFGGSVSITTDGLVIEIPQITLFDNVTESADLLPPAGFFIPLLGGGAMLGPLPVAGVVGILGYVQPQVVMAIGPGVIRQIRITANPLTGIYTATAQLYVAAASGPRLTMFGGVAAAVGTILPTEPPVPLVVSVEGGLRGTGTGWGIGALQSTVTLDYRGGALSFSAANDLMLGALLQGDLDLFAAARIEGQDVCHYAFRLGHWETGEAYRLTVPVTAGYDSTRGGTAGIGPITSGPIPVSAIETAITPVATGWDCRTLEEIVALLCDLGIVPPELCDLADAPGPSGGALASCVANENLGEKADPFISRCRKASIRREFPGELLDETLGNIKKGKTATHKKAWKLLNDRRFEKPGGRAEPAACPVPVRYRQTAGRDAGGGVLYFEYAWESSTGDLADLGNCQVGEVVTYLGADPFVWPRPPWAGSTPNPTIIWLPGTDGALGDEHSSKAFVKPYRTASFSAVQFYRYETACANGGAPVNLMGPIAITRTVSRRADGKFKYVIIKSGKSAAIDPLP